MKHIMIDIETLGRDANATILSIAAIKFDLKTGDTGDELYLKLKPKQNRFIDIDTLKWWLTQDKNVFESQLFGITPIKDALKQLADFIDNEYVWGKGPRFDLGILSHAYKSYNMEIPWKFWNERCVRTILHLGKPVVEKPTHYPLEDCRKQIKECYLAYNNL